MLTLDTIKKNTEEVIARLAVKHFDGKEKIARIIELDKTRRASQNELDARLAELKKMAAEIGKLMKEGKKEDACSMLTALNNMFRYGCGVIMRFKEHSEI